MPRGAAARPAAGRRAGRGAGLPPVPVRARQPDAAGRGRPLGAPGAGPGAGRRRRSSGSGLSAAARKKYRAYSLGMRQRLGLAGALLRPRELFVLDEPTNGLDPQGTREVRTLVREVAAEGATVFVSSHLLSEIEQMCTHVGVMSHGRLVFQGSLDDLGSRVGHPGAGADLAAGRGGRRCWPASGSPSPVVVDGTVLGRPRRRSTAPTSRRRWSVPACRCGSWWSSGRTSRSCSSGLTGEGFDVDQ